MPIQYSAVKRRIRELRKLRGLSLMQLADRLNISYQQVQKYEKGASDVALRRLYQIAEALEVPVTELVRDKPAYRVSEARSEYIADGRLYLALTKEESELVKLYRRIESKKARDSLRIVVKELAGKKKAAE